MIKHLTTHGNSLALVIEKAILDLLRITKDTPLEINTDGRSLVISPVEDKEREKKIDAVMEKIHKKYASTFKALAD
ncbi:MAG TPA: AbrB/MazE/SpoVT family DNA-binding domain-containing protein [Candidatus Omnitrophota bacterium]|nr:AbrB/MazE/SpoVT family DNA-binding domain-containing protein [Candidatus Omnitrophota bacterium]HPS37100.1 AbrB/MazE/SpoVT family DNA-binding domain-containing protein [Candidatus Omnitrophota bacterium]